MGSIKADSDSKAEMDDSGCVQDVPTPIKDSLEAAQPVGLLDLSDDVMLHILKYCSHMDLKALGCTCARLGSLVLDRTLWVRVEGLSGCGPRRLAWLLAHALGGATRALGLRGRAREADGCLGIVNRNRVEETAHNCEHDLEIKGAELQADDAESSSETPERHNESQLGTREKRLYAIEQAIKVLNRSMTRSRSAAPVQDPPSAPASAPASSPSSAPSSAPASAPADPSCPGPQFTLSGRLLRHLRSQCPNLTELRLDYINVNCAKTPLCSLPRGLKILSLRGLKCYNAASDKCFLYKIQDYLTKLEYLDVSECDWLEPASILGLSKMPRLKHLLMCDCYKMSEFVAYASLSSRYGFKALQVLDLRGTPVCDSEVSALSWLTCLEELYVSAAQRTVWPPEHMHYKDDVLATYSELEDWEVEMPDHFKSQHYLYLSGEDTDKDTAMESSRNTPQSHANQTDDSGGSRYLILDPIYGINCVEDGCKDPEPGPSNKRRRDASEHDTTREQNTPPKSTISSKNTKPDSESSSDEDDIPAKRSRQNDVNKGASTSKSDTDATETSNGPVTGICRNASQRSMCVYVDNEIAEPLAVSRPSDTQPQYKILYVNVSRRLHSIYRFSMPVCTVYNPENSEGNNIVRRGRNITPVSPFLAPNAPERLDPSAFVTDAAIRAFGESDNNNINYIQIGNNGPSAYNRRPTRTSLRILSVTGFRTITDRTLNHLATAAPHLTLLDVSRTRVTEVGVEHFLNLRPECKVIFSKFEK